MARGHWRLEDLPWDGFDPSTVDSDLVPLIKAAALVEYNAHDYTAYLCNVFSDDPEFQAVARGWADEEVQHGAALGRWATLADPSFDFDGAVARFRAGYRVPIDLDASVRGSRTGEMIARCIVETGTSSYYTAIGDSTEEPLLREICRRIAADELRHYKIFYDYSKKYRDLEGLSTFQRLKVALSRIGESEDDELAYAYFAANEAPDAVYNHARCNAAYMRRAYGRYQPKHIDRAVSMVFKACGLKPHSPLSAVASRGAWWLVDRRVRKLERMAA
ncbi:ferritin-like domain-containing protein [Azospirillum griseum]|uniref:Ferritin-like domain-containing protein n=1 Tax=Azospirillum griseum TaxID=2496639 RepID=A0A3S0I0B2_9PROT|nr:ferritin-like domain-containing protein [Azospirillum griseum]RTR19558.1 ferritin-like domain-containing protein [Azospirillum griseum]